MKKAINSITFFIALLGSTSPLLAQREWLIHKVDSVFESQIQNLKIPGGIVQIKKEGNIIYSCVDLDHLPNTDSSPSFRP